MSPGSARLAIGFAYVPLLPGIFFMTGMALDHFLGMSETLGFAIGYQLCAIIIVATWVPLWRRAVQWTAKRRKMTVLYAAAILLAPWSVYLPQGPELWNVFCWMLPLWAAAIWFVGTALAWRTRRDFDIERLASCPKCEYSLRGLREIRCPECGWNSTVDDIVGWCMAAAADFD